MPYIVRTLIGKERKVKSILQKHGINSTVFTCLKGYVISSEKPPLHLSKLGCVSEVVKITDAELDSFLNQVLEDIAMSLEDTVAPGDTIKVISGTYSGFVGIVREVRSNILVADIVVFGKLTKADLNITEVVKIDSSMVWNKL